MRKTLKFALLLALISIAQSGSLRAEFLYASYHGSAILSYALNDDTGSITPLPSSPLPITGGSGSLAVGRSSRFLYADTGEGISGYRIKANGSLAPLHGSPFKVVGGTLTIDPLNRFLYAAAGSPFGPQTDTVSAYRIDANGTLKPVPGSPFPTGSYPISASVDPFGRFVYVADFASAEISAYRVLENGSLMPVAGSPFPTIGTPIATVIEPSGRFLYAASFGASKIASFRIGPNGALTPLSSSPTSVPGAFIQDMALDPFGFLYVAQGESGNNVWGYRIDNSTGALEEVPGDPSNSGVEAFAVAVDPRSKFVYVANANHLANNGPVSIAGYDIGPNGALKPVLGSPFPVTVPDGTFPSSIVIVRRSGHDVTKIGDPED